MEASRDHGQALARLLPSSHSPRCYMSWTLLTIWHLFQSFHYSPAFLWFPSWAADGESGQSPRSHGSNTSSRDHIAAPGCSGGTEEPVLPWPCSGDRHSAAPSLHPHPCIPFYRKSRLPVFVLGGVTLYLICEWAWKWLIWLYTYTRTSQPYVYIKESLSY